LFGLETGLHATAPRERAQLRADQGELVGREQRMTHVVGEHVEQRAEIVRASVSAKLVPNESCAARSSATLRCAA